MALHQLPLVAADVALSLDLHANIIHMNTVRTSYIEYEVDA